VHVQYITLFSGDPVAVVPVSMNICIVVSALHAVLDVSRVFYVAVVALTTEQPNYATERRITPSKS
jgi:hypothetical protein